ncbi:TM35B protein, partial [Todus mexicanus]|nr:TM35B protein [Todus mexicanus]
MAAAFRALRVLLGLFFALSGAAKLWEQLGELLGAELHLWAELHRHMKSQFVRFAEVFPLKALGLAPEPAQYLAAVGWLELAAGLLLAFGPQLLQEISNFVLSVVMIGAIYTLLVLREPLAMCAPATLCLGLLLLLNIRGHGPAPK